MKKIVVAMDSFKGSVSAQEATRTCADAVREVLPHCDVIELPVADGGEGFAEISGAANANLKPMKLTVCGPLYEPVKATYFYNEKSHTAILELAQAAGLGLVPEHLRNPLKTTTFGVGELIADAIENGAETIILGIGGSATNDVGMGLLSALNFKFCDVHGNILKGCGENLSKIDSIDISCVNENIFRTSFIVATDVNNILYGPEGATYVFGTQKGATAEMADTLEAGIIHFASFLSKWDDDVIVRHHNRSKANQTENIFTETPENIYTGIFKKIISGEGNNSNFGLSKERLGNMANIPGGGAAGGVGACMYAFLNAEIKSGIDVILDILNFDMLIDGADLIITGEGALDKQTLKGKVAVGILNRARRKNIPVVALGGQVCESDELLKIGFLASFSIINSPQTLQECMLPTITRNNLRRTTKQIISLINYFSNNKN